MKQILITCILLLSISANAQQNLPQVESELTKLGERLIRLKTQEQRLAAADTFAQIIDDNIGTQMSFDYSFAKVTNLSKLKSPDNNFRIYTWLVPLRDGSFAFYGRLVMLENGVFKRITLSDSLLDTEKAENLLLKPESWYGAIYYDIIKTKHKGETYYSLLGFRPNKAGHNEKLIEVLAEENFKRLRFGAKVFEAPFINGIKYKRRPYRMIFRYNPSTSVSIKYDGKQIIMDHLAVPDFSQTGDWKMYGPDFNYQALVWEKGKWTLIEDVELKSDIKPAAGNPPVQQGLPKK